MNTETLTHELTMLYLETNNSAKDVTPETFVDRYMQASKAISTKLSNNNSKDNWIY